MSSICQVISREALCPIVTPLIPHSNKSDGGCVDFLSTANSGFSHSLLFESIVPSQSKLKN